MRRLLTLVLCLLLAVPALAEPGLLFSEPMLEERLWVLGLAGTKQGLLALTMEEGLHLWPGGEESPQTVALPPMEGTLDLLVGDGTNAWVADIYHGRLYTVDMPEEGSFRLGAPLQLDFSELSNPDGLLLSECAPQSVCVADGALYWLTAQSQLFAFSLADGSRRELQVPHARWLAPGPQGTLLALTFEGRWDAALSAFDAPQLLRVDPATGGAEPAEPFPAFMDLNRTALPFVYDVTTGSLLYTADAGLMRAGLDEQTAELAAHLPDRVQAGAGRCPTPLALLHGGRVAVVTGGGILLVDTTAVAPPAAQLTLADSNGRLYFEGQAVRRAALKLPHVQVVKQHLFDDQEAFNLALITGTQQPDLLLLNTRQDNLRVLMDKGYLADLSMSAALGSLRDALQTAVQDVVSPGGKLYALPIRLTFPTWVARPHALEQAGLFTPGDFFDYCDLLTRWYGGLMDEHPQWTPQPATTDPAGDVVRLAYDLYVQHVRASGQPLSFNTELFRRMMAKATALRPDGDTNEGMETEALLRGAAAMGALDILHTKGVYTPTMEHVKAPQELFAEFPVQPRADSALPAGVRAELTVLAVNAQSPNRELAVKYLEAYAAGMDWTDALLLGMGEPRDMPNPDYARTMHLLEQETMRLQQAMQGLEGAALREAQARLDKHLSWVEQARETERLLLTKLEAQTAQRKAQGVYIRDAGQSLEYHPSMLELLERFISGGSSLDQFVSEATQRLQLIERETQ